MIAQIGVLGTHRRREVLEITLEELNGRGGAWGYPFRTVYYSAYDVESPPKIPLGWRIERWSGPTGGGNDFRTMVGRLDPTMDAILLEDDVQPCKNAVRMMYSTVVPDDCAFVTFYRWSEDESYAGGSFWGAQAIRMSARMIRDIQLGRHDPPYNAQDVWLGHVSKSMGLRWEAFPVALVQHVGADSLVSPGARLEGLRSPSGYFPGEDWDAMCGHWPEPFHPERAKGRPAITWCSFHGENHPDALKCPERR